MLIERTLMQRVAHAEDAYLSILRLQMFRFKLQLFSSSAEASPLSDACHLTPVSFWVRIYLVVSVQMADIELEQSEGYVKELKDQANQDQFRIDNQVCFTIILTAVPDMP